MARAFVTSLVGAASVDPRPREAAQARSAYAPTLCWVARRTDLSRDGVYAAKQFGLLVAGAVLSVALFVIGAVGQS